MLEKLRSLRRWGAQYAIPLQVLALLVTFLQVVIGVPMAYFMLDLLDDLRYEVYGRGISIVWWVAFWLNGLGNIALWGVLTVIDADQDGLETPK